MILPDARDCMDMTSSASNTNAYMCLALLQIATALSTTGPGTYSCTLTVSGKDGQDVAAVKKALLNKGFRVTQTTTTLTIKWDNSSPAVAINV